VATAYRSSQSVTNGTAGTSVTVSTPAGIVDTGDNPGRDHLFAFIAAAGAPTITAPAGWSLVTSVASGSSVTLAVYRKLASSEGASWTWTLGSSLRNWGWVGAYTGVDPDDPIATLTTGSETDDTLTSATQLTVGDFLPRAGTAVPAFAAVRAASGSATTWALTGITTPPTERLDTSTNAGAGTDITGAVADDTWLGAYRGFGSYLGTASQSQTAGAAICLVLNPYFTPYDGGALTVEVDAAFGADPDGDQSLWTWTEITDNVWYPAGIEIASGKPTATGTADPNRISLTLLNLNGEWTSPSGTYTADFVRNLPIRVRVDGFGVGATDGYHRGTAFLTAARAQWASDGSTRFAVVDVVCRGRLWRAQRDAESQPLHSAGYRAMLGLGNVSYSVPPVAYWSFEDESGSSFAAAAIDGVAGASVAGVTFAASSDLYVGSAPLATFTATSAVSAAVPTYTPANQWAVVWTESIPTEPGAQTVLAWITTTGTAKRWRVSITPGTSALVLDVYDSAGASLLTTNVALTEADFYGQPTVFSLIAVKNGTGIDYALSVRRTGGASSGLTGTLASQSAGNVLLFQTVYEAGVNGATFGHVGVWSVANFDGLGIPFAIAKAVIDGNAGEWPWERFQRLCTEEGIGYNMDQSDNQDLTMGPQDIDSLVNLLRECEDVEMATMHDVGSLAGATGLLFFPARDTRENATVALTLDFASGQVQPGFEPILDDQDTVNDVEVSRDGGSSARATDAASIAAEGRTRQQITVNTEDDTFLADLAAWRLNLGTNAGQIGEYRFAQVTWNLRHSPELAEDWLACVIGSKLRLTNPPSQYPPDDIDCFVEGYTERLSSTEWTVTANLSPAAPYGIIELADNLGDTGEFVGRLAGDDDAALRVAVNSSATSLELDPNRHRWTTRMIWDAFGRTSASTWTTADSGQTWTNTGGTAAQHTVSGGFGRHSMSAVNSSRWDTISGMPANGRVVATVGTDVLATGGSHFMQLAYRFADVDNTYLARLEFTTAQAVNLTVRKRVAAAESLIGSTFNTGLTHVANTQYGIMFEVEGSTLRAKAWLDGSQPPDAWQVIETDTSITAAGSAGVRSILSSANTNTLPVGSRWANLGVSAAGNDPDDFPLDVRLGGEVVTVDGISTTAATYVAAGAASHADNAAVTPALYAGGAAKDLILVFAAIRSSGTGTLQTPTGYTRLPVWSSDENVQLFAKVHSGSESDPTVTPSGGSAGDTVSAVTVGFRNMPISLIDLADIVVRSERILNASAQDIIYPEMGNPKVAGCVVLALGWKQDDWTSVAALTGFTEAVDVSTTTGSDQGLVVDYVIQTAKLPVLAGTFAVTGGASAISRAAVVALAGGYQTLTVSRSTNSVQKSHAAGTRIGLDKPLVLGM